MSEVQANADLLGELERMLPHHTAENPVIVSRRTLGTVLQRFLANEIGPNDLRGWASLIELCEEVQYEPGFQWEIAEALFLLATPEINGPVNIEMCRTLLGRLQAGALR